MKNQQRRSRTEYNSERSRGKVSKSRRIRLFRPDSCSSNSHGILNPDHVDEKWPLPAMFGSESYAFSLINIRDKRYAQEVGEMSQKLSNLFSQQQIVENDWRNAYKEFIEAEVRRDNLHPGVQQQSLDEAARDLESAKACLLQLQQKRDDTQAGIIKIWSRCREIKAIITKEKHLEKLREEQTEKVKCKYPRGDSFWKATFEARISDTQSCEAMLR